MSLWLWLVGLAMAAPDLPSAPAPSAPLRPLATDWQSMSPLLRVRPFALATLSPEDAQRVQAGVGRTPATGLHIAVVVETPDTLGIVGKGTVELWSRSEAEVFAVARAHTRASLKTDLQTHIQSLPSLSGTSIPAELWTGGDTVSALVDLRTFLGPTPHGALLTAPTRDLLLVHRLTPAAKLEAVLASFAAFSTVGATPGQEPFSSDVYWWHRDTLHALSVEDPDPGRPRVVPGPTLDALRNSLQGPTRQ